MEQNRKENNMKIIITPVLPVAGFLDKITEHYNLRLELKKASVSINCKENKLFFANELKVT